METENNYLPMLIHVSTGGPSFSVDKLMQPPWYWLHQNLQALDMIPAQGSSTLYLATSKSSIGWLWATEADFLYPLEEAWPSRA